MFGRLRTKTLGFLLAACAGTVGFTTLPTAAADAPAATHGRAVHGPTAPSAQSASTYWTGARLRSAKPVDVSVSPAEARALEAVPAPKPGVPGRMPPHAVAGKNLMAGGGGPGFGPIAAPWWGPTNTPPATTSGKVFFTDNNGVGFSCSGSTVNSAGKNLVFTAGHCVHPGVNGAPWYTNWVFIPGYSNGNAPYGIWSARQPFSWSLWTQNGNRAYDIGVVVMNTDGFGRHIVNVVGGQGIEWNFPLSQFVYQFGYPARSPFDGGTLMYCTGWTYNDLGHQGINCNMTEGASGGPWLDDFNGTLGWLDTVNSWVFWDANGIRYKWNGPYFGNAARDLFIGTANL